MKRDGFLHWYAHSFRWPRLRRRGLLWPRLTLGWWSIEFFPSDVNERIGRIVDAWLGSGAV